MKKNGFTLIELLAVIVIIGILVTMAVLSVSQYRLKVKENEKVNLHATIEAAYDDMRGKAILKGEEVSDKFCDGTNMRFHISYDGNPLSCEDNNKYQIDNGNSSMKLYVKGSLLSKYTDEEKMVNDGICLVETKIQTEDKTSKLEKSCKRENGSIVPSKEEILCVKLYYADTKKSDENRVIFDDYKTNKICEMFAGE